MKKKINIKAIILGVACVYGLGSTIYFGGSYINQKEEIATHIEVIDELQELNRKETEAVANLMLSNEDLTNNLDSARQRIEDTGAEISRVESEIKQLEVEKEERMRVSRGGLPTSNGRKITVKVTGYCPCAYCCGEWAYKNPGITASGTKAKYGTIAAPTSIPFGTQMYIEGYGNQVFTVEDTGSAVVYNNGVYVIDMWMPTHEQAYAVGNSIVEAIILN